jgi:hypothetical protein
MALIGGALLLGLYPESNNPLINGIGGATITVAAIISIYEVVMIIFAVNERVNHPARLLVVSSVLSMQLHSQATQFTVGPLLMGTQLSPNCVATL